MLGSDCCLLVCLIDFVIKAYTVAQADLKFTV